MFEAREFWTHLDSILTKKGLTVLGLCQQAELNYRTITTQRNRHTFPQVPQLAAIAETLQLSTDFLIYGAELPYQLPATPEHIIRIVKACENASSGDLYAIEKILGIKKIHDDAVSGTEETVNLA